MDQCENEIAFTHKLNCKYSYLSNLHHCKIIIDDKQFNSVEHFYQAKKFEGTKKFEMIRRTNKALEAHKLAQKKDFKKQSDWEEIKIATMKQAIKAKFDQNLDLKEKLIELKGFQIIDGTTTDKFWGIGDGKGKNLNGQILMQIRDEYLKQNC